MERCPADNTRDRVSGGRSRQRESLLFARDETREDERRQEEIIGVDLGG